MNNILDEITYSDGRMENGCTSSFVDSPAKLKLRARTYEGIAKSVQSRRSPAVRENKFEIPSAYMAMDIPNGENGGGNSLYTPIASVGLEQQLEQIHDAKMRRVKVNEGQRDVLRGNAIVVQQDVNVPVVDVNTEVAPVVAAEAEVPQVTPVEAVVAQENVPVQAVVEQEVAQTPVVPEVVETQKQEMSFDQQYDEIRKKLEEPVAEEQPVVEEAKEDPVDNAMKSNDFSEVEATRTRLVEVDQAYLDSEAAKNAKNERLLELNATKEDAILREADAERTLKEIYQENDTVVKREEEARQLKNKLGKELRNQVKMMESVIAKRSAQIRDNEKDMEQLDNNISEREQEIAAVETNIVNLQRKGEDVSKDTSERLAEVGKIDNEILKIQEIIDAIRGTKSMDMQHEADMEAEVVQSPVMEEPANDNVVPFPVFDSSVYGMETEDAVVSESDDKVYSYGSRAA